MPYPNEHACRLREPGEFEATSFRREKREHEGKEYSVIYGRLKGETEMTEQAYRYPKATWTESAARAHCRSHNGKSFEAAAGEAKQSKEFVDTFMAIPLLESDGKDYILRGIFAQADTKNANDRIYPRGILEKEVERIKTETLTGLNGHPEIFASGKPTDIALKFLEAWLDEAGVGFCRAKIIETQAGKDFKVLADEKIPIGLSMRGYGTQVWEDEKEAFIVQEDYKLSGIDAVLEPAFETARVIREQKEKTEAKKEEAEPMDKLLEQIEALSKTVADLNSKVATLSVSDKANSEKVATLEADKKVAEDALAAKKEIQALLSDADKMKGLESYRENIRQQLDDCPTPDEVKRLFPKLRATYEEMHGKIASLPPKGEVIFATESEQGFFGKGRPKTIQEAYKRLLDRFPDNGQWFGDDAMNNKRYVAKTLIDNYLKLAMVNGDIKRMARVSENDLMANTRNNPLHYHLQESVGDDETYSGNIATTAAYLLPLYVVSLDDIMTLIQQVCAVQPMDRDTGLVGFMKEYYSNGAGSETEIDETNFDKAKAAKGEETTPQLVKVEIATDSISLETAVKVMAEWTVEAANRMSSYWGLDIESAHLAALRKEVMREIAAQVLYKFLTGTSCTHSDACISVNHGSELEYPVSAPEGWSNEGWLKYGMTQTIKKAAALIKRVNADIIIADKNYSYLFTEPQFVAQDAILTNFGFNRIGTFQSVYKVFTTDFSWFSKKILVAYRGSTFAEAAMVFLPYILFYLGGLVEQKTGNKSRTVMSWHASQKVFGKRIAEVEIIDA